jgi:hypothetical protein
MKISRIWQLKHDETWRLLGTSVEDLKKYIINWDNNA